MPELPREDLEAVARYVANHPGADATVVLTNALGAPLPPAVRPLVEELVDADDPLEAADELANRTVNDVGPKPPGESENLGPHGNGAEVEDGGPDSRDPADRPNPTDVPVGNDQDTDRAETEGSRNKEGGDYAGLYLEARRRADGKGAFVPHDQIEAVFREQGWSEVVDDLRYQSEWIVFTPGGRDTPIYAYTPDLAGDTARERRRLADLLAEAGVGTKRFIDVLDGQKASFDTGNDRHPDDPEISGNYGVKGGRGGDDGGKWLVDIDVDDYDAAKESHERVDELREETLAVASAHTTTDTPGHLYVVVDGDAREVVRELLGRNVENPAASFGEIRVESQYVVGPGSEILCDCSRCASGAGGMGRYELANERPPVEWSEAEFREFLLEDPAIRDAVGRAAEQERRRKKAGGFEGESAPLDDAGARLKFAKAVDKYVADALREASNPDDRSQADAALARAVGPWLGYDEREIADVLDKYGTSKWETRTDDSYRDSVLDYATDRAASAYQPLPYWAVVEYAVVADVVDRDELVYRDSDAGDVVADPDENDGDTYLALPSAEAYNRTLEEIEAAGVEHGREPAELAGEHGRDARKIDPRDVDVVIHPRRAWDAAGRVVPDDLDDDADDLPLEVTDGGGAWACPDCGDAVGVVRATAIATGRLKDCSGTLGEDYHAAYRDARERYGAPLPRYLTNADATARYDEIVGCIHELGFFDLDRDALVVDVAAEGGDTSTAKAALEIDPTPVFERHGGWRESESSRSVVVYPDGHIRDYGHPDASEKGVPIDPLRFVALERGLIDDPRDVVEGAAFRAAITAARVEYGAPLPRWENSTPDGHTPLLPPAEDLVGEEVAGDELQATRDAVEDLYREATEADTPTVLNALPAAGKTTAAIKTAAAGVPTTYLAPRKSLMQQAREKANEHGATWRALPVFGGKIDDDVLERAVEHVREKGRDSLRNRWEVLGAATDGGELPDTCDEADGPGGADPDPGDEFDAVRPTCPTAEGEFGDDWQLAVHVARRLDFTPRDIHERAEGLFGHELPCQHEGDCPYTEGWDAVRDPDDPADLLIGHYAHAHVESARTYYERDRDERVKRGERAVVIDEFPGFDTYADVFGPEATRHAAWLAGALRDDVEDSHDLLGRDLWADEFVRAWLNGQADEIDDVRAVVQALETRAGLLDAVGEARRLLANGNPLLERYGLDELLEELVDRARDLELAEWYDRAAAALENARGKTGYEWVLDVVGAEVLLPVRAAADRDHSLEELIDGAGVGGELRRLVTDALEAADGFDPDAGDRLRAARDALVGGDAGTRELAVWATDGWAHRDAHHLLRGIITPAGEDHPADRLRTRFGGHVGAGAWGAGGEGASVTRVIHDGVTVVVDRDGRGATVHKPPERTAGSGEPAPLVGLDATGRRRLWQLALGHAVDLADVHTSPRERERFLREQLGLRVVQVGDEARPYEGDPSGKDLDGDVALVEKIHERYSGIHGPRTPRNDPTTTGRPAVITTKTVRQELEADARLDDVVAEWENYGNVTGENDLDDHTLAALLGSPHYGHHTVDHVAALAGEEAVPTGRGIALDYGTPTANAYLKHMREDQVMQAILRFARGGSGALVFARTSALRRDLPVVGCGDIARTWSDTATAIAEYAARHPTDTVTVADLAALDEIDVGKRHIRRILGELASAGYLRRVVDRDGVAAEYEPTAPAPDTHAVDRLPETPAPGTADPPGRLPQEVYYTANVRVRGDSAPLEDLPEGVSAALPAPRAEDVPEPGGTTG